MVHEILIEKGTKTEDEAKAEANTIVEQGGR